MKKETKETPLALISEEELSLVDENILNKKQLQFILRKTPEKYVKQRVVGGKSFSYVTGGYIKKCLNLMFGWNWNFEITDKWETGGHVIVEGKLTCVSGDKTIIKTQFGSKMIEYPPTTESNPKPHPIDIGFDYKAAATDCLKKCASEFGIAADIYNAEDFREIVIGEKNGSMDWGELQKLYDKKINQVSAEDQVYIERIIKDKETDSYSKVKRDLLKLL